MTACAALARRPSRRTAGVDSAGTIASNSIPVKFPTVRSMDPRIAPRASWCRTFLTVARGNIKRADRALQRGGLPRDAGTGPEGYICQTLDVAAVADVPLIDRLACRAHVVERFSVEAMANGCQDVYGVILGAASRRQRSALARTREGLRVVVGA